MSTATTQPTDYITRQEFYHELSAMEKRITRNVSIAVGEIIADALQMIAGRFDQVDARFNQIDARLDKLELGQARAEKRLDRLEAGQARVEKRLDKLETGQTRMESRLQNIEQKLDNTIQRTDWHSLDISHIKKNLAI